MTRRPTTRGRWLRATGLALLLTILSAGPAAADPPGPTRYRAEVVGLDPQVEGVSAAVLGGDAFLQVSVDEGHEVVVRGYDDQELYLRFDANGEVFENLRSRTYYQNQSRYDPSALPPPSEAGPEVPPDWQLVSTDGSYAWHDHRIHWMSPSTLPFRAAADGSEAEQVDPDLGEPQLTTLWPEPVPIVVDGQAVGIAGQVTYLPAASPALALVAGLLALVLVVGIGWRSAATGILVGGVGGAVVAIAVSVPQVVGLDSGVQGQPIQLIVPGIALLAVAAGVATRDRSAFAMAVAGASGVALLGWVFANSGALTAPIVPPGTVPTGLVRAAVGVVGGCGLGALVVGIRDLLTGDALSLDPGPETAPA